MVEAILKAATELVGEGGIHGLTTNHIARRAGVSVGSLYRYFPDKESIIAELDLRYRRAAADTMLLGIAKLSSEDVDLEAALARILRHFMVPPHETLAVRRMFMRSVPLEWIERGAAEIWSSVVDPVTQAFRRLRPEVSEAELRRRVIVALHAVQGVALASIVWEPEALPGSDAASELARMLAPYLLAPSAHCG
ncbi:MAG: TetR/AcrR family transcriptional regulator [Deltaproteobacteria bacterium]|nr:TetR/AcrR family transcriptional regulator [Deltaproteobacteria bacterium]